MEDKKFLIHVRNGLRHWAVRPFGRWAGVGLLVFYDFWPLVCAFIPLHGNANNLLLYPEETWCSIENPNGCNTSEWAQVVALIVESFLCTILLIAVLLLRTFDWSLKLFVCVKCLFLLLQIACMVLGFINMENGRSIYLLATSFCLPAIVVLFGGSVRCLKTPDPTSRPQMQQQQQETTGCDGAWNFLPIRHNSVDRLDADRQVIIPLFQHEPTEPQPPSYVEVPLRR